MAKQLVFYSLPTTEVENFRRFVAHYNATAMPADPRAKATLVALVDEPEQTFTILPPGRVALRLRFASAAEAFTFGLSWQQERGAVTGQKGPPPG